MDVLIQDMVMCKASNILNYNALTNRDSSFYNNEQSKGINLTQYLIVFNNSWGITQIVPLQMFQTNFRWQSYVW